MSVAARLKLEHGDSVTQEFSLNRNTSIILGSDPDNSVVLTGEDISRHHTQIAWNQGRFAITDLGSATGTWVNGMKLSPRAAEFLRSGDQIKIGAFNLEFFQTADSVELPSFGSPLPGFDLQDFRTRDPAPQPSLPPGSVTQGSETQTPETQDAITSGTSAPEEMPPELLPGTKVVSGATTQMLQVSTSQWVQDFPLKQDTLILGRNTECDICIDLPVVSAQHAQLTRKQDSYEILDLKSKNGLCLNGERVSQHLLVDGDVLLIGDDLTLTFQVLQTTQAAEQIAPLNLRDRALVTIGRDPDNDTVIDHPVVSRFHAKIELQNGSWTITDLDSSNGTFVNGTQISGKRTLRPSDTIRIGPNYLVFTLEETLFSQNEAGNLRLDAVHLVKVVGQGATLLNDVSLAILPKEFVAIVGSSGAGKSTLLDALNGFRPANSGVVLVNANDLYKNYNAYRTEVGYVPQDDIIHQELEVLQALDYSARLRLPPDMTPSERRYLVQSVLADLELTQRQDVLVKNLSGGQRKRVSIGVELLTRPSLFFLDEATSGLDPGTEVQMMRLLRKLADGGRTILLITHATKNVMMCNMVVFLAKGGRVAYYGPPDEALVYFGVKDFDEIYLKVDNELSPETWQERYQQSAAYQTYVIKRQQPLGIDTHSGRRTQTVQQPLPAQTKGVSGWRQFFILTQRNLAILLQDRGSLLLMLALAPILGAADFVMWNRELFDPRQGDPGQSFTMAFLSVLIPVIVGSLATMREIVKEAEIYRRERMVGLKILPYILSKVGLSVILALYQAAIFLLTKWLSVDLLRLDNALVVDWSQNIWIIAQLYITLFLATLGGMVMGLLVSALSANQNAAPLLTILFLVPQITFAGAILPLKTLGVAGQAISQFTVTRWAYESMVTTIGVGKDIATDPCWGLPEDQRKELSDDEKLGCKCLGANLYQYCHFPGLWKEYKPEVSQSEPIKPPEPGDPPEIPANPLSRTYQDQVQDYNDRAKTYTQSIQEWQTDFGEWKQKRGSAIAAGEALVSRFRDNQGNTFRVNVLQNWGRMVALMTGMLVILVFLQKRKDII
jgi:ABC transport system ATP-binding/permease protein